MNTVLKKLELAEYLHRQGSPEKAIDLYEVILKEQPDNVQALHAMSHLCYEDNNIPCAVNYMKKVCAIIPADMNMQYSLGVLLEQNNNIKESEEQYRYILTLNPRHINSLLGLGNIYSRQHKYGEASKYHERVLEADDRNLMAHFNLGLLNIKLGNLKEACDHLDRALEVDPNNTQAATAKSFILHNLPDATDHDIYTAHVELATRLSLQLKCNHADDCDYSIHTPIRVGYVSPDFRRHSVAYFIKPILESHNKSRITTWCYSNTIKPDTMTDAIKGASDNWRDISKLDDNQAAELIRGDGIDILVDLAGYTTSNRLGVFMLKPAPVQVTWIGYPGTTGLNEMDYRITDSRADPVGDTDNNYSEELVRVEPCFLCYQPPANIKIFESLAARTNGFVTFGSFNNLSKYSDKLIDVWAKILGAVPNSRILLKAEGLSDPIGRGRVQKAFCDKGIDIERIECIGFLQGVNDHLALYNRVDIALDTFPYNGTTTTCEALWMGVPVITLQGNRHASRVGGSLLHSAGLEGYITISEDHYINLAVTLSKDVNKLEKIHNSLRRKLERSSLTDMSQTTASIENAYSYMTKKYKGRCAL